MQEDDAMEAAAGNDRAGMVGIVLVNWNGGENVRRSYASLTAGDYRGWKLFIVDNASEDDSVEMIRREIPDAILIESGANLGFAGGCNIGIKRVLEMGLEYVFLLNSDARVLPNTVSELVSASRRLDDKAILGSLVRYFPSGKVQYMGSRRSLESGRPHWYTETEDSERLQQELIEGDFIFGAALFAPSELFRKVGLFDERFFLNFEETDWCYRAAASRIASYVVTKSVVQHIGSASLGARTAPLQTYFLTRNRLLFYDKHGGLKHRLSAYLEVLRDLIGRIKRSAEAYPPFGRLDPSTRALLCAIRDYGLRRFGDCPARVRELGNMERASRDVQPAHD
jgi:GT2 family glycosyltransferase